MSTRLFRALVQFANKRVQSLPHLSLIQGNPKLLAQKLRDRQERTQTERSIYNIGKIYGYSEQEINAHKTYFCNLFKTPEKQQSYVDDFIQRVCGSWCNKNQTKQQ